MQIESITLSASSEPFAQQALAELHADWRRVQKISTSVAPHVSEIPVTIEISSTELAPPTGIHPTLFTRGSLHVLGWGSPRLCIYSQPNEAAAWVHSEFVRSADSGTLTRKIRIVCPDPHRLHELAWITLHSVYGEMLERRGLRRLHALSLYDPEAERRIVITLPSGGGKSALAALLAHTPLKILSDECAWIDPKTWTVHPFATRLALRPDVFHALQSDLPSGLETRRFVRRHYPEKMTFDLPDASLGGAGPLTDLIVARPEKGADRGIVRSPEQINTPWQQLTTALELAPLWILGLGLPQMAEQLVRLDRSSTLIPLAAERAVDFVHFLRSPVRVWNWRIGKDARANRDQLLKRPWSEHPTRTSV